ncbi:MAG: HAD-IC family P-type ATPase, partial [Staphylococcus simulans]|nr:HAD-IC family P-type ATPase [Staphylococcus simulans]
MFTKWIYRYEQTLTLVAFIAIVAGILIRIFLKDIAVMGDALLIFATAIAMLPIGLRAIQALRFKMFSIELLISIAVIGALFIGEFIEAAVVTFLFLFGSYLEKKTLERTRRSIQSLTELSPEEALIKQADGSRTLVSIEEVSKGDRIILTAGSRVPVDGHIIEGEGTFNEASITGESVPLTKRQQDTLYSSTILESGYVEMIADKVGEDTAFAKIIDLIEEAQETKSNTERFLDRFAKWYTPAVIVLATIVGLITWNLHLAITFLVIACPGALIIGAPVSSVAGIGNGAKHGVLIKGSDIMETLAHIDVMVDKTGTLTKGQPELLRVQ